MNKDLLTYNNIENLIFIESGGKRTVLMPNLTFEDTRFVLYAINGRFVIRPLLSHEIMISEASDAECREFFCHKKE